MLASQRATSARRCAREKGSTDDIGKGVYRNLVERMAKPDFTLAQLQREIGARN